MAGAEAEGGGGVGWCKSAGNGARKAVRIKKIDAKKLSTLKRAFKEDEKKKTLKETLNDASVPKQVTCTGVLLLVLVAQKPLTLTTRTTKNTIIMPLEVPFRSIV